MRISVDAVLFDIDGTLVDSTGAVERTWRLWAEAHGTDPDEILEVSHGRRSEDTIAMFLPDEQVAEATAELEELELADLDGVTALPAAAELLAALPATRWAAVTSGTRRLMTARLEAAGLPVPGVLVTADDVTVGKPDPQGYLRAAARLGHDPARCLVVEDAPAGIRAGLASGAAVLAVATSHDRFELEGLGATEVVDNLTRCSLETGPDGLVLSTP
ncbi:haloacid dehalogenase [Nocardiopsis terrae]|uniref:Sugar-phosphatase n=1 Tax=Nocardiopsis terrae TaxID=372655 RepID=A0ABR9HLQ8_9ACTN|nr:HAD-IA family hydrolase [Nocardiopsis terrae]MBE1459932.1 sugar-phosphatase [Nocardiopsis terrae]GHC93275.1 haloacid dehalogenase [Nocardiopsis terrae]